MLPWDRGSVPYENSRTGQRKVAHARDLQTDPVQGSSFVCVRFVLLTQGIFKSARAPSSPLLPRLPRRRLHRRLPCHRRHRRCHRRHRHRRRRNRLPHCRRRRHIAVAVAAVAVAATAAIAVVAAVAAPAASPSSRRRVRWVVLTFYTL